MSRTVCWLALCAGPCLFANPRAGGPALDGEAVTCHFPTAEHLANKTGRDGLGLCAFTSIDHAARWANEPHLIGLRDHMTTQDGGGWPEKVDRVMRQRAQATNARWPGYLQHTGGDAEFLKKALQTGRYPCVTYAGNDGVFYRGPIHHMVNLAHLGDRYAAIHDNNFPGRWLWLPTDAFLQRWRASGGGWAIVLLKAGPPPIPVNRPVLAEWTEQAGAAVTAVGSPAAPEAYAASDPPLNFGVLPGPVNGGWNYRLNGRDVPRGEAYAAMETLPDDARRGRLTAVGDAGWREKFRHDWETAPALAPYRERLHMQDYPADHWAARDVGFATGISHQPAARADGKAPVLFRFRSYPGPELLAAALRQADPDYNPSKDTDPLNQPAPPAVPQPAPQPKPAPAPDVPVWANLPPWAYALVALFLVLLMQPNREKKQ